MRVAHLDFGTEGAQSLTVRVASEKGRGYLVVRQDHAKGKVLAKFLIEPTGGDKVWEERTFVLTSVPTGVHDLHFSFLGSTSESIFNWDWWQFNQQASAVPEVRSEDRNDARFYTLQGIPVERPTTRGIYIKNGKKVVM